LKQLYKSDDKIEFIRCDQNSILVSSEKFYHIFRDSHTIRIGTNPKKDRFGAAYYKEHVLCGRTNGIIWKADPYTGKVETSLQFMHQDQKISYDYLF
jgi:hypothetical protein